MDVVNNKKNAIAFYKMAYEGMPRKATELYVGDEYVQHNPSVADGTEAFIAYFESAGKDHPRKTIEFVRLKKGRYLQR